MTRILYGIPQCDTVKKARAWLDAHAVAYAFHDYKKAGVDAGRLNAWCDAAGWEAVINRKGTTFRQLPEAEKAGLDRKGAIRLMLAQPSMIKRPILTHQRGLLVGFQPEQWQQDLRP